MSSDRARVAFIGLEHPHSLAIHLTLLSVPGIERLVVVEPNRSLWDRAPASAHYPGLNDLFTFESPHLCFVMQPTNLAAQVSLQCIERGCHVFLDKHGANSSDSMEVVVQAAERRGVQVATGYLWRNHGVTQVIKDFLRQGLLGAIWAWEFRMVTTSIESRLAGAPQSHGPERPVAGARWLFDKRSSGGGILFWLACHYMDWIRFVLGSEVSEVCAMTARRTPESVDVEDVASVSLRMTDGALGTIHAGYITPAGMRSKDDSYIAIQGSLGDLRWTPSATPPVLEVRSAHREWRGQPERSFGFEIPEVQGYGGANGVGFFEATIRACRENRRPPASGADAASVLRIFEAAYQSAEHGLTVRLSGG